MMLAWRLLGVNLAVKKGQLDTMADWIGLTYSLHPEGVFCTIMETRMAEIKALADKIAHSNVSA